MHHAFSLVLPIPYLSLPGVSIILKQYFMMRNVRMSCDGVTMVRMLLASGQALPHWQSGFWERGVEAAGRGRVRRTRQRQCGCQGTVTTPSCKRVTHLSPVWLLTDMPIYNSLWFEWLSHEMMSSQYSGLHRYASYLWPLTARSTIRHLPYI